jgi:hypothetical protein
LCLLFSGFTSAPAEAQVRIPRPVTCTLRLNGLDAWLRTSHRCQGVEVETRIRRQDLSFPFPGGTHRVQLYFFDMRARQVPAGGQVLVAQVDVSGSPQCSYRPPGIWSEWTQCSASSYSMVPPAYLVLSSTVLVP